jgi:hypothetical protein
VVGAAIKLDAFQNALRWLYAVPLSLCIALIVESYVPLNGFGGSPRAAVWGLAGACCCLAFAEMYGRLLAISEARAYEPRVFNEKVKLLATTINIVAMGGVAAAVIDPFIGAHSFDWLRSAFLFFAAMFTHIGAQRVLSLMMPEGQIKQSVLPETSVSTPQ